MASITKQKSGWRVQIFVKGQRDSATKATKAEAQAWAVEREAQMRRIASTGINTEKTVQDAFDRYAAEVSPTKRNSDWEQTRLIFIAGQNVGGAKFGALRLCEVTSNVLGQWRDARMRTIKGSTFNRDMALLSHVFSTARKEWKWIAETPTADVRRQKSGTGRERLPTQVEIEKICHALGFDGVAVRTKQHRVAVAYLFAIECGMRAGEICGLREEWLNGRVVALPAEICKNGMRRDVPLSKEALRLLSLLPKDDGQMFGLTSALLDALFRKARDAAGVIGTTFHDSRHAAITRLAKKLTILELARAVGHRNINQLQTYYNESAEDIADRL